MAWVDEPGTIAALLDYASHAYLREASPDEIVAASKADRGIIYVNGRSCIVADDYIASPLGGRAGSAVLGD